jgi:hypothetical protein
VEVSVTEDEEKSQKLVSLDRLLKESDTFRVMQVLLGQYILLEQFFMAESVQKVSGILTIVTLKIPMHSLFIDLFVLH